MNDSVRLPLTDRLAELTPAQLDQLKQSCNYAALLQSPPAASPGSEMASARSPGDRYDYSKVRVIHVPGPRR